MGERRFIKILHISPDFNYSCGISKYVYSLLKDFGQNKSYKLFFITNGGDALDKLDNINIKPSFINFSKGFRNILNICPNLKTLRKFCFENKIDIIHTHHRYPEYLAYLISKKTNIKTVTTVHSLVKGKKRLSFKADKIIAVSNSVKSLLNGYYNVADTKITMLHNYLEPIEINGKGPGLNIRAELGIPDNGNIILFIGRLTKLKGVDLLIRAFKILREKNKNIYLLILGQLYDSNLKAFLKNLPDGAKLLNVVKNPYPYYLTADLVVLPTRIDSFPFVMLEAGILRRPFLGTKTGGIEEFIEDGVNGLLFEPENVNQIANKIEYLLNSPEISGQIAENLNRKVVTECSRKEHFNILNKIYDELIF